jgi:hypothetical protein
MMKLRGLALFARLLTPALLLTYSLAQSVPSATPTVTQLLGTWRLVSAEVTMKDGSVEPVFGPRAQGFAMYEPDGQMCVEIMNPDRPSWKNPGQPTSEEKLAAFDGFFAYCGTYNLDAEHSTLTYYPKVAWIPPYVGSTQPRPFRLEGKRLMLMPASSDPAVAKTVVTWERTE